MNSADKDAWLANTDDAQARIRLKEMRFDNRFFDELPADPVSDPTMQKRARQVFAASYSEVRPTSVSDPKVIAVSREVMRLLDLSEDESNNPLFAQLFAGNELLPGMAPYAACYGGHQFGSWAGQLGDGRAISLGEVKNRRGEHWELQLKGAGKTPYSRGADGRAVMRSSVREFLCSEAMFHLGVPTTRALSLVATGDKVERDMFYSGNPQDEPGAIVCRVAPSFIRFGNFEIFSSRKDLKTLRLLAHFTIRHFYPELLNEQQDEADELAPEMVLAFFEKVAERTSKMIVEWMRVGFVHGVMNTDNMSILGLTIDYGPYGWLENYDPNWTPNTTDAQGRRYAFGRQAQIALWNLYRLAQALLPLVKDADALELVLARYASNFDEAYRTMMVRKLGLTQHRGEEDDRLLEQLLSILACVETDMTIFFRQLADYFDGEGLSETSPEEELLRPFVNADYQPGEVSESIERRRLDWAKAFLLRCQQDSIEAEQRRQQMNRVNPKYVLRNYLAQLAIEKAEQGDGSKVDELLEVLRKPYDEQPGREEYAEKRPEWARHRPGCSMLSCSS